MKASELIAALQVLLDTSGDYEVLDADTATPIIGVAFEDDNIWLERED